MFAKEVLVQDNEKIIYLDSYGVKLQNDPGMTSLPMELEHPVEDRNSWNAYKEHYSEDTIEQRLPPNWDEIAGALKDRDFPIRLGGTDGGFLGFPRTIMGLTDYLVTLL